MGKRLIGSVGLKPGTDTGFDLDEKGQIHGYSDTQFALPVGDDNQVLSSLASEASGLKWVTPSTGLSSPLTSNLVWNDNVKAQFGTGGGDSEIYHDGNNLYQKITTGYSIFTGDFTMSTGKCMTWNKASATISSGTITGSSNTMVVDTEGAASTDDLDSASFEAGGTTGAMFTLAAANDARTIVVKDQAVSPFFLMAGDFSLENAHDTIFFSSRNGATHNYEISRSDNA